MTLVLCLDAMRDGGGAFQKNQNLLLVRKLKDLQAWEANLRWEDGLIPLEGKHTDVQGSLFLEVHTYIIVSVFKIPLFFN